MGTSSAGAEPGVLEAILLFYPSAVAAGRGGAQVRHSGGGAAAARRCDIQSRRQCVGERGGGASMEMF